MTTDTASVRPESLMNRADPRQAVPPEPSTRAARWAFLQLLNRISRDRLTVLEGSDPADFGPADGELQAVVRVHDQRTWTALLREGSIGLRRGYPEGWWDSDDPTVVVQIIIRNIEPLDELRNRLTNSTSWLTDRLRMLTPRRLQNGRHWIREDIASHYDLGNDFFRLFLVEPSPIRQPSSRPAVR